MGFHVSLEEGAEIARQHMDAVDQRRASDPTKDCRWLVNEGPK